MSGFSESKQTPAFPTTHWSQVVRSLDGSSAESRAALESLCAAYWYPLYAFIRRRGHDPDAAADLVQGLFAHLLERKAFAAADPDRGRFRTFLLAVSRNFIADRDAERRAKKRGGGHGVVSLDALNAENRYGAEPVDDVTPERLFERAWALAMLERALGALRAEYQHSGKGPLFEHLEPSLAGGSGVERFAVTAEALNMSEGAVNVAAHRLRRRYRELVRDEIATTVDDPCEIDDELRALFGAVAS